MVIIDNSTRWNSTFLSIQRALKVKQRLQHFCLDYRKDLDKDYLSDDDWTTLTQVYNALEVFHQATLRLEGEAQHGHHGSIWEALPVLEALLEKMEEGRQEQETLRRAKSYLAMAHQNAWEKLNKYYNLTDNSHQIYAAALLLHPSYRKHYFDHHWVDGEAPQWKEVMINSVRTIWNKQYKMTSLQEEPKDLGQQPPTFIDQYLRKHQVIEDQDPFDSFITGSTTFLANKDNIFNWFNSPSNPNLPLRDLAFDLLSIPAMSAAIERIFSSGRRLVTPDRGNLNDTTIEMRELMKNWWSNNIVAQRR
jgi:hAT family C-terminal dimerisation region